MIITSRAQVKISQAALTRPIVHPLQSLPHILIAKNIKPRKFDPLLPQQSYSLSTKAALGRRRVTLHKQHHFMLVHELFTARGYFFFGARTIGLSGFSGGCGLRHGGGGNGCGWGGGRGRGRRVLGEKRTKESPVGSAVSTEKSVTLLKKDDGYN